MNKKIILLLLFLSIASCSFQSSQYNLIKGLITKEGEPHKPKKTWTALWLNTQIDLYAINIADQIIFADDAVNIFYKDQMIYKITGLFTDNTLMDIDFTNSKFTYRSDGKLLAVDSCGPRNMTIDTNQYKYYSQTCMQNMTGDIYENQITINNENVIVGMKFKVHPGYPLLELNMK